MPIRPYGTSPEPKPVVVNCVAPEAVPCVFLAEPTPQRHITPNATEEFIFSPIRKLLVLRYLENGMCENRNSMRYAGA